VVVFERDPHGVAADGDDTRDALVVANGSFARACKDAEPQFGKDDATVNGFASIRFDRTLDGPSRAVVDHALASRGARPTSWAKVGNRTYVAVTSADRCDAALAREFDARIDTPALCVLRVRPQAPERLGSLAHALLGPGRPQTVIDGYTAAEDVIVELTPCGRSLRRLIGFIDEILAATPGRTIVPILPLADTVLAQYASERLRESDLTSARVLETYVERYAGLPEARA